ncbi:Hypothetical predicted protein, partial [Paramuricea clavata]
GKIVYHGRDIPGTNIENFLQYALLPYNSHIPEPRGLNLFTKGLVEVGVNKDLIKNEYLLTKMAKEEHEMPQSESDVESKSGEENRESDKSDNESEYDDNEDDDNEDDGEPERLACNHCGEETGHIVYLMKCPRCSWKDFYWGKDAQCMICDEQSPLLFSHVIGFCEVCSYARMTPEAREDYERFILSDRPKYIPMKPEKLANLSPEDKQEYENSLKITKTPRRYALRTRSFRPREKIRVQICCTLIYACTRKATRLILRYTPALKNNPYLSIGIHLVMQIRITLIPLITYTPPNDLATHNNATFAKFKTCLLIQITDDSVKNIYVSKIRLYINFDNNFAMRGTQTVQHTKSFNPLHAMTDILYRHLYKSSYDVITPPHSSSLLLTPPHSSSLLLTPPHSSSLLLTSPHSSSLLLTPPHSSSLLLTPPHSSTTLHHLHHRKKGARTASILLLTAKFDGSSTSISGNDGIEAIVNLIPKLVFVMLVLGRNMHSKALVGVMYRSIRMLSTAKWLESLESLLSQLTVTWDGMLILTEDMNIDMLQAENSLTKQYQCMVDVFGLHQVIEKPTRVTKSSKTLIDHLITNFPQRISDTGIIPCSMDHFDHDGIYASINVRVPRFEARHKYIRDIKSLNESLFIEDFSTLPLSVIAYTDDPDEQLESLNSLFVECLERHAPLRRVRVTRPPSPWMKSANIQTLQKERDHLRHKAHKSDACNGVWTAFRLVRNNLKSAIRSVRKAFIEKALSSNKSRDIWRVIHRILKPNPKPLRVDPDELNTHFATTTERTLEASAVSLSDLTSLTDNLPEQSFRKGHSTTSVLLGIRDDIRHAMNKGEITLMVLADFSKAFDTICFKSTIEKFYKLGFSKTFLKWLLSYLSVADLTTGETSMNKTLTKLSNWSQGSNLALNPTKTKCMLFTTSQMSTYHSLSSRFLQLAVEGKVVERVKSTKLLGVHLKENLKWDAHVKHLASTCYALKADLAVALLMTRLTFGIKKAITKSV